MTEGEKKKEKRVITITFNQKIGVALIMSLEEYTPEECKLAWFQAEDYSLMEDECELTSEFLTKKKMLPPALCGRGLEGWTIEGEKTKDKHVGMAVELVWQAQLAQWTNKEEGGTKSDSDASIAKEYEQITIPCHQAAHLVGLEDEKQVKRYLAPIKNMEKTRQKMQSLLAKNQKHANANANTETTMGKMKTPPLKPAIRKQPPKSTSRQKTRSGSPDSKSTSPITAKKKGGLDLLDKIERRIDENATMRSGGKSMSQMGTINIGSTVAPSSPNGSKSSSVSSASGKSYKKIDFRNPKRAHGVPLSPQGSVHSSGEFSSGSRRHFASHQSVCSTEDGSVRRRMLKAAAPLTL
jgi:hypothetical protein